MTNILLKIFARGFYREHAGFLVFMFVALFSYCFFIETAGDIKLLSAEQVMYYHFIILVNFVTNPVICIGFLIAWLIYTVKSWNFVSGQLLLEHNQFLFYSVNAFTPQKRFKSWFYVQFIISLPFVLYTLIAAVTGIMLHYYFLAGVIVVFTLLLIAISAIIYIKLINKLIYEKRVSWLFRLSKGLGKPFFSLFIYHVFDKLKVTYALSKLLSYIIIISMFFALRDVKDDPRVAALTILGVVMAHAVLIYQQQKFESVYLDLSRNFPYSKGYLYLNYILGYLVLLIPECTWLLASFSLLTAIVLLALSLGVFMLFHSLLYKLGLSMNRYLPWIFGLFFLMSLLILFGFVWMLIPLSFGVSFILFYFGYYNTVYV